MQLTQEIPPEAWASFFDEFSREHLGDEVRVEVLGREIGAQCEVRSLPLNGITAEPGSITISAGDRAEVHVGHVVASPTKVSLEQRAGVDEVLEIQAADHTVTLVYLI